MNLLPYVVAYIAIGIFLVAVIARFLMWSRLPMHVRWELYPVAHEAKRAHYGGSYLEETDWWTKPRENSLVGEMKVMVPEILFLEALHKHNRKLWYSSFPFHFGLYLMIACTVLMILVGFLAAVAPSLFAMQWLSSLLQYLIIGCGAGGLVLNIFGALGLLLRRLIDPELKDFTTPADLLNLVFFVLASGVAFASFLVVDRNFSLATLFAYNLVTFKMGALAIPGLTQLLPTASVILLSLLVAYIPMTHMSHFIGKFFAYHAIRWNDTPNLRGGSEEEKIKEVLGYPVTWAAPHIKGDGRKTWADVATEEQKK
jgi:nitrate reductase gamma subunit